MLKHVPDFPGVATRGSRRDGMPALVRVPLYVQRLVHLRRRTRGMCRVSLGRPYHTDGKRTWKFFFFSHCTAVGVVRVFEWRDFCVFLREMRSHLLSPLAVVSLANVERLNILRGFVRHRLVLRNTLHDSSAAALTHSARGLPERRKARGGKRSREKHRFERLQREEKRKKQTRASSAAQVSPESAA